MKGGFVYITTNNSNSTYYVGVTNDIVRRIWEHKNRVSPYSFTSKYKLFKLVYLEFIPDNIENAIHREKELKGYSRERKLNLITTRNPTFRDLYDEEFIKFYKL